MIQWQWGGWLSLGIHLDWRTRLHARYRVPYGPYFDLHLGPAIFSVGRNCYLATEFDITSVRGGVG